MKKEVPMKKQFMLSMIALLILASNTWARSREVNIGVKGMVCGFCAQGIEKKFKSQAAVDQIKVSLGEKQVKLTLKDGADISDDVIRKLLAESGYNVEKIQRN